jgi:26S proteasome regulatory subunit T1
MLSFQEAAKYMDQQDISNFLDGAIRSRISIRFIAEQHIALTRALCDVMQDREPQGSAPSSSGIVDSECSAANMINACGSFVRDLCEANFGVAPTLQLEGITDAKFKCVESPAIA